MSKRKEIYIALGIIIIVFTLALSLAVRGQPQLEEYYPSSNIEFQEQDFTIIANGITLAVGSASFEEVTAAFPQGEPLGMSTIYQPKNTDCLLTFTKKGNILHKIHIGTPELATFRGCKVGDPFSRVIESYGEYYAYVRLAGELHNFDAVYGEDNSRCIIFQVRQDKVVKIILQNDPLR